MNMAGQSVGVSAESLATGLFAKGGPGPARRLWWFIKAQPLGSIGAMVLAILLVLASLAPWVSTHDPTRNSIESLRGPSSDHFFGTDRFGRDIYSRIVHGARISLWVGLVSVAIGTGVGTLLGTLSGYFRGLADLVIQRVVDSLLAFPWLVLALAIVAALGNSITNVMIAIGILLTPNVARVVRGTVLSVREEVYVEAARVLGAPEMRIILRHILPNAAAPIIVLATVGLGNAIIVEAALSFLGMGTPPPAPSWGRDLAEGRPFWITAPHVFWPPLLAITLTVFGFNLFGDALRDTLDPRLRRRI
jgi:peptide/nickel transport system permease protein